MVALKSGLLKSLKSLNYDKNDKTGQSIQSLVQLIEQDVVFFELFSIQKGLSASDELILFNPFSNSSILKFLKDRVQPKELLNSILISFADICSLYGKEEGQKINCTNLFLLLHNSLIINRYYLANGDYSKFNYSLSLASTLKGPIPIENPAKSLTNEALYDRSSFISDADLKQIGLSNILQTELAPVNPRSEPSSLITNEQMQAFVSQLKQQFQAKIQSMQAELEGSNQKLVEIQKDRSLQSKLEEKDREFQVIQTENKEQKEQIQQLKSQKEEAERQLAAKDTEIQQLRQEILKLNEQNRSEAQNLKAKIEEASKLKELEIKSIQIQVLEKNEKINAQDRLLNESKGKIASLEQQVASLNSTLDDSNAQIIKFKAASRELAELKASHEAVSNDLKLKEEEFSNAKQKNDQLNQDIIALKAQIDVYKSSNASTESSSSDLIGLTGQVAGLTSKLETSNQIQKELREENEKLKSQAKQSTAEITDLKERNSGLNDQFALLENKLKQKELKIDELQALAAQKPPETSSQSGESSTLVNFEIEKKTIEIEALNSKYESSQKEIHSLNLQIEQISSKNQLISEEKERAESEVEALKNENEALSKRNHQLQTQILTNLEISSLPQNNLPDEDDATSQARPAHARHNEKPPQPMIPLYWEVIPDAEITKNSIFPRPDERSGLFEERSLVRFCKFAGSYGIVQQEKLDKTAELLSKLKGPASKYQFKSNQIVLKEILKISDKFSLEEIGTLLFILPSEIEKEFLLNINVSLLDSNQQFLLDLSQIILIEKRLKFMELCKDFGEKYKLIESSLVRLNESMDNFGNVKKLAVILNFVLEIGNYLNGGTKYGGVSGFRLNFLNQLSLIPTSMNGISVLDYISLIIRDKQPDLFDFVGEFSELIDSVNEVDPEEIIEWINQNQVLFTNVMIELPLIQQKLNYDDMFAVSFQAFYGKYRKPIEELKDLAIKTQEKAGKMIKTLGGNAREDKLKVICNNLKDFSEDLKISFEKSLQKESNQPKEDGGRRESFGFEFKGFFQNIFKK